MLKRRHLSALLSQLLLAGVVVLVFVLAKTWIIDPIFRAKESGRLEELILRMVCAGVTSFLIVLLLSPKMIRWLIRQKLGDRPEFDHAALNEITRHKSATPTMGGVLIVLAIGVSTFLFGDCNNFYIRLSFLVLVWLGGLGAVDDWYKLRRPILNAAAVAAGERPSTRDGLKMWQKILFQIALAVLLAIFIYQHNADWRIRGLGDYPEDWRGLRINPMDHFYFPFRAEPVHLGQLAFVLISVLVVVGSSNAVNLTDGMDGLAGGCMFIVTVVFLILSWVGGVLTWANQFHLPCVLGAQELSVLCAGMAGACIGFLWYNCQPAQYFMGDTGSLPLGGLIGYIAVVTRHELMLFIAGGVFVIEAISVLMQVTYFKATGGRRIFRCAPIHHHFHLLGWAESKVVVRFWLLCAVLAAVALATLTLR